jgi:hypothetical protein
MKTFVLIVSTAFPKTHKRSGELTGFVEKIRSREKRHTIRANYDLWKKRIDEVNSGAAMLSVRVWTGKPYNSKQKEVFQFIAEHGIGIQKLEHPDYFIYAPIDGKKCNWYDVAKNDGLLFDDFCDWFKVKSKKPMAIIHFTEYRY